MSYGDAFIPKTARDVASNEISPAKQVHNKSKQSDLSFG